MLARIDFSDSARLRPDKGKWSELAARSTSQDAVFKHLDGERSLKEIFENVRKDLGVGEDRLSNADLLKEFRPIYEQFKDRVRIKKVIVMAQPLV